MTLHSGLGLEIVFRLAPGFGNVGTELRFNRCRKLLLDIELHYYRRLPALHGRFDISAANANNRIKYSVELWATELPTELCQVVVD